MSLIIYTPLTNCFIFLTHRYHPTSTRLRVFFFFCPNVVTKVVVLLLYSRATVVVVWIHFFFFLAPSVSIVDFERYLRCKNGALLNCPSFMTPTGDSVVVLPEHSSVLEPGCVHSHNLHPSSGNQGKTALKCTRWT